MMARLATVGGPPGALYTAVMSGEQLAYIEAALRLALAVSYFGLRTERAALQAWGEWAADGGLRRTSAMPRKGRK